MRSIISLVFAVALPFAAHAQMCLDIFSIESRARDGIKEDAKSQIAMRLEDTFLKVENLVDLGLETKLLSKKEVRHLREDLAELKQERNKKQDHPTFQFMLEQWSVFIAEATQKVEHYRQMPKAEQKMWKSKIELPLYFATGHFIVFLETGNKNFDYQKMTNILETMNNRSDKESFESYIYVFEKSTRRFFSERELRRCKA